MSSPQQRLALAQVAPWWDFRMRSEAAVAEAAAMNERLPFVFSVVLRGGEVHFAPKPGHGTPEEMAGTTATPNRALHRARAYRRLLADAAAGLSLPDEMHLVLAMRDLTGFEPALPVLTFQKPRGSRLVLLPDIDFLVHDFYRSPPYADTIAFADKSDIAFFAGATTGKPRVGLEDVRQLALPRLRAAVHFRGSARVQFRLPTLVECETEEVAQAIHALGITGQRVGWSEAYRHRYLLSMDGNGATCSRVALALRSNSVLVKYESAHRLHYFDHLIPWTHYIPVERDEDVERVMDICAATPGLAQSIAEAGSAFYRAHLERAALLDFTRELLAAYAARCWCA